MIKLQAIIRCCSRYNYLVIIVACLDFVPNSGAKSNFSKQFFFWILTNWTDYRRTPYYFVTINSLFSIKKATQFSGTQINSATFRFLVKNLSTNFWLSHYWICVCQICAIKESRLPMDLTILTMMPAICAPWVSIRISMVLRAACNAPVD